MIKAVLLDFDGTLVTQDILDVLCGIVGKEKESEQINKEFHAGLRDGISALLERINFLQGVTLSQLYVALEKNLYLIKGAKELLDFLNEKRIVTVLNSGNIVPVLEYYQKILGITYIVGTQPQMDGGRIIGIDKTNIPQGFKLQGIQNILGQLSIKPHECLAIGDSPADKKIFEFAGKSIAINPKNGIENYATYVIRDDLRNVIPIIKNLMGNN